MYCSEAPYSIVKFTKERFKLPKKEKVPFSTFISNTTIDVVCEYLKVPRYKLLGQTRQRHIHEPRQMAMHLIYYRAKKTSDEKHTLKQIGQIFNNRDHTTVRWALKKVDDLLDTDKKFKANYFKIKSIIESSLASKNE